MSQQRKKYLRFGVAVALIVLALGYLAWTGVQEGKMYYVTVKELQGQDNARFYGKHLRLVGNVKPGSIHQVGTSADFLMEENGLTQRVVYKGAEPPPDTFKDNAQALAIGHWDRSKGVFVADELQAKCASKYAPQQQQGMPAQPQSKGY